MSDFKSYKKAELASVAAKVGLSVRSKDTKQSLLEKIELFLEQSPEKAKELLDNDDSLEVVTLVENDATEEEEDDDEEDEEEEEEEEEEKVAEGDEDEEAFDDDEDDEDDKDYNAPPPINLKEWIVDPAIAWVEATHDKVLAVTDSVGATTLECNAELRESLSKTVSLNFLEAAAEAAYFLYLYVPLVPVQHNRSVHQVFRDNIPQLNSCTWLVPDVSTLASFSVASILFNWVFFAVALPLLVSYYVNFSRRVVVFEASELTEDEEKDEVEEIDESVQIVIRAYKYDPFIFALLKVLIHYALFKNAEYNRIAVDQGIFHAVRNLVVIELGIYHTFISVLGNFPLVVGLANVVVALYSQFEDY